MRRPIGHWLLIVMFTCVGGNALNEALRILRHPAEAPAALMYWQFAVGGLSLAAVIGIWQRAEWTSWAIGIWGAVAAAMIIALGPLLELEPAARDGLRTGAALLIAIAAASAWYLRRSLRQATPKAAAADAE